MGSGMATQIFKAGFPLTVYNRTADRAAALQAAGAHVASSPAEAARSADAVISMVADDAASRHVWLDDNGILSGLKPGAIAVECSTLSTAWVRELAREVEKRKCEFLDAPVTGSKTHAASGELQFLVGGDATVLERVRPVLKVMSRNIVHIGPIGSGALVKLINNYLCGVQAASLAEAMALIERSGLNRDRALEILNNGAPGSPLVKTLSARMTSRNYDVNFLLRLMQKDLNYATQEAEEHGLAFNLGPAAVKLFEQACKSGWSEKDFSAVVEALR
jgi:3-hydroxyisobutyrate dehydrogenase